MLILVGQPRPSACRRSLRAMQGSDRPACWTTFQRRPDERVREVFEAAAVRPAAAPVPSSEERGAFLAAYVEAIGRLSAANKGNLLWWASDLASKNRFKSPLPVLLEQLVRAAHVAEVAQARNETIILVGLSTPVQVALEETWRRRGHEVQVVGARGAHTYRLAGKWRAWKEVLRGVLSSWRAIWTARRSFGRGQAKPEGPVYLVKSFAYPSSWQPDGQFDDPFFGRLASELERLLEPPCRIVTVTVGSRDKAACYSAMSASEGGVWPLEAWLTLADPVRSLLQIIKLRWTRPIRVPDSVWFADFEVAGLLRALLAADGWKLSVYQYLHRVAGMRLARSLDLVGCTLTNEGNPWERMLILGLRAAAPTLPIAGYQHSVVPQSAAGMFVSADEADLEAFPDVIVTTGEATARLIRKHSGLAPERVVAGCALRYENATGAGKHGADFSLEDPSAAYPGEPSASSSEVRRGDAPVLVALEGVEEVADLVEYVMLQAQGHPEISFRIRAHPVLGLDRILRALGRSNTDLPVNVEVSVGRSVAEDLADCRVVLYWGTTVAVEAIFAGRPLVHFDRGDLLSYDPLFELHDFKRTVRFDDDLGPALEAFGDPGAQEFADEARRALAYCRDYFAPVTDEALAPWWSLARTSCPPEVQH